MNEREKVHEIEIFVRKGLLRCSKEVLTVKSTAITGRRVKWLCKEHDYAIQFANHASPFDPQVTSFGKKKGEWTDSFTVTKRRQSAEAESYKYSVAVHIPENDPPILMLDPIIIVDDEAGE